MTAKKRIGPLFTDLYELTMAASYHGHQISGAATFSLFVRNYPPRRNYFVAAGLEDVLKELEAFSFSDEELAYLESTGQFKDNFISFLSGLRFSGEVHAMPEGTVFFPGEPVLEITAPIIEAQLLETFLLNKIGFASMIASKSARCIHAAQGRPLIDFSLRRTQEQDAGLMVARSTFMTGFEATSNVLAGKIYGIPVSGTMAHSYVTAFNSEEEAFRAYSRTFPDTSIFLIDTFDTLEGARRAATVATEMKQEGKAIIGVRIDSGDMVDLSCRVRRIFDAAGLAEVKIFASGGFDEYKIAQTILQGARIDAFGVGTKVGVSADAPYLNVIYKMVRFNGRDVRKLSPGKATLAGAKQVFRKLGPDGRFQEDVIGLRDDRIEGAAPLLEKVMENGKTVKSHPPLSAIREKFKMEFSRLPEDIKSVKAHNIYPVHLSQRLQKMQEDL
ncbi:MAG: nicotinate phosphoribosyltransferase [Desulfobacterales bacterium]|nr:nicotinate phosphoribosyltransferase [Desulfobacterales bacterium]